MSNTLIMVDTTNTLKADVAKIDAQLGYILNYASQLEGALQQLESMWDGQAKEAFFRSVRDDLNRLKDLVKAMKNLTSRTDEARREYDKCESMVSQIIASIKV